MTLNELRYIVAVAQESSFRRAAERVFVSQPALSLAIQKLEEELGVQIFERSRTAVSMTPIGELIVTQAQRALEEVAQIKEIAQKKLPDLNAFAVEKAELIIRGTARSMGIEITD